jgi:hypothetical protein
MTYKRIIFMMLMVLVNVCYLAAQGREVKVRLNDGHFMQGELLAVRDSELVLWLGAKTVKFDEGYFHKYGRVVRNDQTAYIVVIGENNFWRGCVIGGLLGVGVGALSGYSQATQNRQPYTFHRDSPAGMALEGAAGLGLAGTALGGAIGLFSSKWERTFYPFDGLYGPNLDDFARFRDDEPPILQQFKSVID